MNRSWRVLPVALATAALWPAAPAVAAPIDVPAVLGAALDRVSARTPLAVLLPDSLDLGFDEKIYVSSIAGRRSWSFSLAGRPRCGNATACALASFSAQRGATPGFRSRVRLRGGIPGWFKPLTCGASCSPPVLQYRRKGVLFEIAAKVPDPTAAGQRRRLVRAANEALRAGPR